MPVAAVPNPDIYTLLGRLPAVAALPAYQSRTTGQYTHLTVIGDSYADWGNAYNGVTNYNHSSLVGADGRYGNGANIIDAMQYRLGLATSAVTNYAWGGATTGSVNNNNPALMLPGMAQEMQVLQASGQHFGISDLIEFTTASPGGGNDAMSSVGGVGAISVAQGVINLTGYVQTFMNLGARNFVFTDTSGLTQLETGLVPFANAGARIFMFDQGTLVNNIKANPGLYGFTMTTEYCSQYGGPGNCNGGAANSTALQTNAQILAEDQSTTIYQHPTAAFAGLMAQYQTNLVNAPSSIAAQSEIGQMNASAFSASLFNRLDAIREMGKSDAASSQPWTLFADGDYQSGSRADRLFSFGYNYNIGGGTLGVQYRVDPNMLVGVAVNVSVPHATLNQGLGHFDVTSYQLAGFVSLNYTNWFADAVIGYGFNNYDIVRPGVILGNETANANGSNEMLGVTGGYLFDVAPVKVGPIAGINYTNAFVAGYTEQGDYLLNQSVSGQRSDLLTGRIGVQVRLAEPVTAAKINPYVNLTAEHEFLGGNQTIVTVEQQASLIPITTPVTGLGQVTYGKVAGGFSATLIDGVSAHLDGSTTFARKGGNDYGVMGGLMYRF